MVPYTWVKIDRVDYRHDLICIVEVKLDKTIYKVDSQKSIGAGVLYEEQYSHWLKCVLKIQGDLIMIHVCHWPVWSRQLHICINGRTVILEKKKQIISGNWCFICHTEGSSQILTTQK